MNIKKGMAVRVISGNSRGEEGKVLHVFPKKDRIIIEGVNLIKRHTRPSQDNPQGGIVEREGALHVSNVMVVHGGKPTRVGFKKLDDGTKIRVSKRTGEEIG
ncbi:MAG: 50S ribosomal protein L24 [Candidatus Marinimicrobia bacterium]|jgi:large subunit ribosomal protein L24|nr:50S ribosomal protein L24 [Candidatus Neomarinimicrobiota bacterium]MBT4452544.1 50S ribosomal protein L24 [Candidatus Neomarinimicrobiota bacterium]MBT6942624.1 50S ribosomal protein L24 [Candidatus Neomarinimicrobiota bacterium]MBT7921045.1 50S ribosomal protein L24 [Candidatus Neomarinimicrobiota bacterium]MBU78201.1 50S ribosomal protein L24 [Candidatus Neomarinimicrobiota bacterium]|tara:strand:- start:11770 stop:12075 length:306 start_codon:yes stop_codon:yes gene_type:complete